jgi:hypothetical protein
MDWLAPHLTGGLGNRLFQYAAAAGLAEKWHKDLVFFLPRCSPTDHGDFENIFRLFPHTPHLETAVEWITLEEPKHKLYHYLPFPDTAPTQLPIILHGWRQSEKYFPKGGVKLNFLNALGPQRDAELRTLVPSPETTWFVHVRLGDYRILPHHQVDLTFYYAHCLTQIPEGHTLILFSDEPHLCAEEFAAAAKRLGLKFEVCSREHEVESLFLMSLCKGGAITANSTFSWWGAYCAKQGAPPAFKAYYPSQWGDGMPPPVDVIPSWGVCVDLDEVRPPSAR